MATVPADKTADPRPSGEESASAQPDVERHPNLITRRVEDILLVASPYDSFMLEENGLLTELIYSEYTDLGLTHAPDVTHVATGEEALETIAQSDFDLVISTLRLGDMDIATFGRRVRKLEPDLPVVLLIASESDLEHVDVRDSESSVDSVYVWHGDAKIFLAIIKVLEDRWNVEHDTSVGDVGVIILVEDSRRFRSSLLPIMYAELVKQTRSVMADGINHMHKLLRMRARPKILVAETYEQGMELYTRFRKYMFGVIADIRFPRDGRMDPQAGIEFIRQVKSAAPDTPALLQSSDPDNRGVAESIGASFLHKRSNTLLQDVRAFMLNNFGFGDFVFRLPDQREVARARDLRSMVRVLADTPAESIEYHARHNHFSNWLRARTEFALARRLRPRRVSEFSDIETLRRYLIRGFNEAIRRNRRGMVEDFSRERFDSGSRLARIGGGSLGGKARGLAFVDALLAQHNLDLDFGDVRVHIPQTVVIATDVFDAFLERNRLRLQALNTENDEWLRWAFQTAQLPEHVIEDLRAYVAKVREPLAVRSSSLLEDSQLHPLAGVYETYMIPNNHPDDRRRLTQLCDAIKLVYASTFSVAARRYLEATPHRIEEEKMAVVLQPVVGRRHEDFYYPQFAGVADSYNYYPIGNMKPDEGLVSVALGLGATVVGGGPALRFCPAHPRVLPQLNNGKEFIDRAQRTFLAVDLRRPDAGPGSSRHRPVVSLNLEDAERHGTLAPVGSVWSPENSAFYDGIYRDGVRVVTFAHILKSDMFPLADLLKKLLDTGRKGMNGPVEIEFAGNVAADHKELAILQMRPCVSDGCRGAVDVCDFSRDELLCFSPRALGNGVIDEIRDVIYVKPERFDVRATDDIAREIAELNLDVLAANSQSLLIGPGRWGSSNRSLGIPVNWSQISSARIIVETTLDNFAVESSQGSHFFHNLTSLGVAYLTVNPRVDHGFIDWRWLDAQPAAGESSYVRRIRLDEPLEARIDGRISHAVIRKRANHNGARVDSIED